MALPNTQKDFQEWDRALRKHRKDVAAARRDAVGILNPDMLRRHGRPTAQDLILDYGKRGGKVTYTPAELQAMVRALKARQKIWDTAEKGAPRMQLIASSFSDRVSRANGVAKTGNIGNALLGKIRGNSLTFRVTASRASTFKSHQVVLRLEDWNKYLLGTKKYVKSVKKAVDGRISIQCSCPDFQYRFRYLATLGNFVVSPPKEHGFPKITNPNLKGCCCKHILKCLSAIAGLGIQRILAREMEKQAVKIGFGDDKVTRFLNKDDLKKAARAVKKPIDQAEAKKLWAERKKLQEQFKKRAKEVIKEQAKEIEKQKKAAASQKKRADKMKDLGQKHLVGGLKTALEMAAQFDIPRDKAIETWAKNNDLSVKQADKIAKDNGL